MKLRAAELRRWSEPRNRSQPVYGESRGPKTRCAKPVCISGAPGPGKALPLLKYSLNNFSYIDSKPGKERGSTLNGYNLAANSKGTPTRPRRSCHGASFLSWITSRFNQKYAAGVARTTTACSGASGDNSSPRCANTLRRAAAPSGGATQTVYDCRRRPVGCGRHRLRAHP